MTTPRTIAYFLRIDEFMSTETDIRYDVLRQYVADYGEGDVADDAVEWENCTLEQGVARLRQLYAEKPPTF